MRVLVSIVLVVLVLGVGAVLGMFLLTMKVEPPRRESIFVPPLVETAVVQARDVSEQFLGYGSAEPIRLAELASEVSAVVAERVGDLRAGTEVEAGQSLIRLDDREFQHALERAEARTSADDAALRELDVEAATLAAQIKTAEQEVRVTAEERARVARLFETDQAARKEFDFATLAFEQARRVLQEYEGAYAKIGPRRARLEATKQASGAEAALMGLNIERCEIRAPFAGRVESVLVEAGDHVRPGSPVLRLVDATHVEIPIQLPVAVYDRVQLGAVCDVMCESMPGVHWRGAIARIGPTASAATRTFAAYVIVDNGAQQQPLIPGVFVTASVAGPQHSRALLIPRSCVRNGRVLIVADDRAAERQVTPMRFMEDMALVRGELEDGDRLILSHLDQLVEGSPVRFRTESAGGGTTSRATPAKDGSVPP